MMCPNWGALVAHPGDTVTSSLDKYLDTNTRDMEKRGSIEAKLLDVRSWVIKS